MSDQIWRAKEMLDKLCQQNCYFMHMENSMLEPLLEGTKDEMIGRSKKWLRKSVHAYIWIALIMKRLFNDKEMGVKK